MFLISNLETLFEKSPISKTRRFFFFLNSSRASGSKLGAKTISVKTEQIDSAVSFVHLRLKATTPPKADKESALKAFVYVSKGLLPTATPQGFECLTITHAGSSKSLIQARAPSASIILL